MPALDPKPYLSLLCCNLPTTQFSKCFDPNQRVTITRVRNGDTIPVVVDAEKVFHHNVKYVLKYCEASISPDKFEHLFGFTANEMLVVLLVVELPY